MSRGSLDVRLDKRPFLDLDREVQHAASTAGGEGGGLDRDEVLLHAGQKRLAFIEREADRL